MNIDKPHVTQSQINPHHILSRNSRNLFLCDGKIPKLQKGFKFMLLNIRSLISKLDSLVYLLSNNKIDILCLNETFCDETISNNELYIEGLQIERKDRTRSGGGVAIYISSNVHYVRRKEFEDPDLELICIQLYLPLKKIS